MAHDQFIAFVLDQLSGVPGVKARRMFGGHGLYSRENFFGILHQGRLYLRVDDRRPGLYEGLKLAPFTYAKGKKVVSMKYFEVPASILEDRRTLTDWSEAAIATRQNAATQMTQREPSRAAARRRRYGKYPSSRSDA